MNENSIDFSELSTRIVYEDNHILLFNKKAGQIVQGDKTGDIPLVDLLKELIKFRDHKPGNVFLGVVHRLDRPASGLTLFAKTSKALERLNEMFQSRELSKTYLAITTARPEPNSGKLVNFLKKNEAKNKSFVVDKAGKESKEAILEYKLLASSDRYHLCQIELYTGRHHQIRVQLANIGCPIKGDLKYGAKRSNPNAGIDLIAYSLQFIHPVKKEAMSFTAPLPEDNLWKYFAQFVSEV